MRICRWISVNTLLNTDIHHHRHHVHHLRDRTDVPRDKIESLPAELIIEAIFNPRAASEESPFTYIPKGQNGTDARRWPGGTTKGHCVSYGIG